MLKTINIRLVKSLIHVATPPPVLVSTWVSGTKTHIINYYRKLIRSKD